MKHALSMINPKKIPIRKPLIYSMELVFFTLISHLTLVGCRVVARVSQGVGSVCVPCAIVSGEFMHSEGTPWAGRLIIVVGRDIK